MFTFYTELRGLISMKISIHIPILIFIIGIVFVTGCTSDTPPSVYEEAYEVSELLTMQENLTGKNISVRGYIERETVKWDNLSQTLTLRISDMKDGKTTIDVVYKANQSKPFIGEIAVATGQFNNGVFKASEMMMIIT